MSICLQIGLYQVGSGFDGFRLFSNPKDSKFG